MDYLIEPWKHQLDALEKARRCQNFALFFEMGCGKTATMINILRHRYGLKGAVVPTLIICPVIVVENWRREISQHSRIPAEQVVCLTGPGKNRVAAFHRVLQEKPGSIVITNYEALLMENLFAGFLLWKPEILVLDESHYCKDGKSKRTKQAIKLSDIATHKYLLSGTPVLNSAMDLFSQFRILDGGKTFSKNFFIFRATYFYDENAGMPKSVHFPNWKLRPNAIVEMNNLIYRSGMRVTKKECLDLPPLIRQKVFVGMTPEQSRMYLQMKEDFIAYLDDKACVATLAITKALRLMEIVSGYAKLDDDSVHKIKNTPRMEALKELLEQITPNHKVLIWAVFKENYGQIRKVCDALKLKYVEVHGDIPNKDKYSAVDAFNSDPDCRVLIGHPGSGGIGINLTAASYSIWFSRSFSLSFDLQAEARNHRGGSEIHEKITRIDLVTPGTIDELVLEKLANKEELGEQLLSHLRKQL